MTQEEIEAKKKVLRAQLEIIQGYLLLINNKELSLDDIVENLWSDRDYLQQEFALLEANSIFNL